MSKKRRTINKSMTAERCRELFHYDQESGILFWKQAGRGRTVGRHAGHKDRLGYYIVKADGAMWCVHRLIWLYVYGVHPSQFLDHIDRDPSNNKIANLREATCAQNGANRRRGSNNTSGIKGVVPVRGGRRWQALIYVNQKPVNLGFFGTKEEASEAYAKGGRHYFGEFWAP